MAFGHVSVDIKNNGKHTENFKGFLLFDLENISKEFNNNEEVRKETVRIIDQLISRRTLIQSITTAHALFTEEEYQNVLNTYGTSSSLKASQVEYCDFLMYENDKNTIEEQLKVHYEIIPELTGINTPTLIYSGGKSIHTLINLGRVSKDKANQLGKAIGNVKIEDYEDIKEFEFDKPSITNRVRVAGVARGHRTGEANGRGQNLIAFDGRMQELLFESNSWNTSCDCGHSDCKHGIEHTPNIDELVTGFRSLGKMVNTHISGYAFEEDPENEKLTIRKSNYKHVTKSEYYEMVKLAFRIYAPNVRIGGSGDVCPMCLLEGRGDQRCKRCTGATSGRIMCLHPDCGWYKDNNVNLVTLARKEGYLLEIEETLDKNSKHGQANYHIYNEDYFLKPFERRKTIYHNRRYLPALSMPDKRIWLLESGCGNGKSTITFDWFRQDKIIVLCLPLRIIKDQKFLSIITDVNKIAEHLKLLGTVSEENLLSEAQKIHNRYKDGFIKILCPEGFRSEKNDILDLMEANPNMDKVLIMDEVHNLLVSHGYRNSFFNMTKELAELGFNFVGLSGTMPPDLIDLLLHTFEVGEDQLLWEQHITDGHQRLNVKTIRTANGNIVRLLVRICLEFSMNKENLGENCLIYIDKAMMNENFEKTFNAYMEETAEHITKAMGAVSSKTFHDKMRPMFIEDLSEHKKLTRQITICTSVVGEGNDLNHKIKEMWCFTNRQDISPEKIIQFFYRGRLGCNDCNLVLPVASDRRSIIKYDSKLQVQKKILENKGIAINDGTQDLLRIGRLINNDNTIKYIDNYCYIFNKDNTLSIKNDYVRKLFLKVRGVDEYSVKTLKVEDIEKEIDDIKKKYGLSSNISEIINQKMKEEKAEELEKQRETEKRKVALLLMALNKDTKYYSEYLNNLLYNEDEMKRAKKEIYDLKNKANIIDSQFSSLLENYLWNCFRYGEKFFSNNFLTNLEINKTLTLKERINYKKYFNDEKERYKKKINDEKINIAEFRKKVENELLCYFDSKNKGFAKLRANDLTGNIKRKINVSLFRFKAYSLTELTAVNRNDKEDWIEKYKEKYNNTTSLEDKKKLEKITINECLIDTNIEEFKPLFETAEEVIKKFNMSSDEDWQMEKRAKEVCMQLNKRTSLWKTGIDNVVAVAKTAMKKSAKFADYLLTDISKLADDILLKVKSVTQNTKARTILVKFAELRDIILNQSALTVP